MADNKVVFDLAINTADAASSIKEVRESIKALKNIQLEFGESSDEYVKASVKIGQLKDTLNDANDTARVLTGNVAENLTGAFSRVASAGIGAFQAVEGAQAVFGVENEDLQKQMVKLQGLLNLSAGIKEFANIGQAAKDFKVVLGTLIPSLFAQTAATEGAAVAQTGLNAAMKANPIGAIITVLTLLVGAIALFTSTTDDATESQELNSEELEKAKKTEQDYKKSIDDTNLSLDDRIRKLDDELAVLGKSGPERERILAQQDAENRKRELLADKNVQDGLAALERLETLRALGYLKTTSEFIELKKLESSELVKIGLKAQEDLVKIEELKVGNISEINKQARKDAIENAKKTAEESAAAELQAKKDARKKQFEELGIAPIPVATPEVIDTGEQSMIDKATAELDLNQQLIDGKKAQTEAEDEYYKVKREQELLEEQQLNELKVQAVYNGLSTIANLAQAFAGESEKGQEKAFKIQKAVGIASTIMDTYQSATKAYNSLAGIPVVGPVLGGIAAGAAVAAGLANVQRIRQQQFRSSSAGGGVPPPPPPPNLSGANQPTTVSTGQFTGFGEFKPGELVAQRVYVVESDISGVQRKVQVIENRSKF
jgi:hypothetical protein